MPRLDYRTCRNCDRGTDECGQLSHTRLCLECAIELEEDNNYGIAYKSGPAFRRWRHAMAACVGGALLDEFATTRQSGD